MRHLRQIGGAVAATAFVMAGLIVGRAPVSAPVRLAAMATSIPGGAATDNAATDPGVLGGNPYVPLVPFTPGASTANACPGSRGLFCTEPQVAEWVPGHHTPFSFRITNTTSLPLPLSVLLGSTWARILNPTDPYATEVAFSTSPQGPFVAPLNVMLSAGQTQTIYGALRAGFNFMYGDPNVAAYAGQSHLSMLRAPFVVLTTNFGVGGLRMRFDSIAAAYESCLHYCPSGTNPNDMPSESLGVSIAATPSGHGYWTLSPPGIVHAFGSAQVMPYDGGAEIQHTSMVILADPAAPGYWVISESGAVTAFGQAPFLGDTYTQGLTGLSGAHPLNARIVGAAVLPDGQGYWLVASDGGIFSFGQARFLGNPYTQGITGLSGSHPLDAPIVGMVGTPNGAGYWLVAADGGVFAYGDANFLGNPYTQGITGLSGSHPLNARIVGMTPGPHGAGYVLVGADGGTFAYGDAQFVGNLYTTTGHGAPYDDVVGVAYDDAAPGYWVLQSRKAQVNGFGAAAVYPPHPAPAA